MSLRRETLPFVLVTASKVLSVVATSVITFCFVFPSLMFKSKKKILLQVKIILQNSQKMTENVKCSLSFLSVNKILFLISKTVLKSSSPLAIIFLTASNRICADYILFFVFLKRYHFVFLFFFLFFDRLFLKRIF